MAALMQFRTLVRPEHLNHHGFLFGGYMLQWVDEYVFIAATVDFPGARWVTRAMDAASFQQPVNNGDVLRFDVELIKVGHTSAVYSVNVFAFHENSGNTQKVFAINVTMCNIKDGKKCALPPQNMHN